METLAANGVSFPVFLAYGFLILTYMVILKLLLNLLQQLGDKHRIQKSVTDADIHRTMTPDVYSSMQTFDVYSVAIVIAKWGIAALAMAVVIVLLVIKVGIVATTFLIAIMIALLWAYNRWQKSREKPGSVRAEVHKFVAKSGNMGMVILLSIVLVVLLFVMIAIH